MSITLKTAEDIDRMRVAGRLASELLDYITPHVKPGMTTGELDRLCHDYMVNVQDTMPAPLNYAPPGYPPLSEVDLHVGQPRRLPRHPGDKKLKAGDIVNIDVTVIKDGYHGDTSRMFFVGEPSIQARRLVEITYEAMWRGIARGASRARTSATSATRSRSYAEAHGFIVVREFCGHGIGRKFHEEPQVLHYGRPGPASKLQPGMIFTIEPMINAGRRGIRALADGWTIVTADHSLSAQWEHTVLVTDDGYEVLTRLGRHAAAAGHRRCRDERLARRRRRAARLRRSVRRLARWRNVAGATAAQTLRAAFLARSRHAGRCCASTARLVDASLRDGLARIATCRPTPRWSPSAAMAAASCSRIPTSTC